MIQPRLLERSHQRTRPLIAGTVLLTVACLAVMQTPTLIAHGFGRTVLTWLIWTVGGFGMGLAYPSITLIGMDTHAGGHTERNASALVLSESLGSCLGMAIPGALYGFAVRSSISNLHALQTALTCLAAVSALLLLVAWTRIKPVERGRTAPQTPTPDMRRD